MIINKNLIKSGEITSKIIHAVSKLIKVGAVPAEINSKVEYLLAKYHAKSAFKDYQGYPASCCISVNEILVHGIPSQIPFKSGDVVSFDFGVNYNGWFSDSAITISLGKVNKDIKILINSCQNALKKGILQAREGNTVDDISNVIFQEAINNNFGVVRELSGHGIGKKLHLPPIIPNYITNHKIRLKQGMILAIEPMFSLTYDQKNNISSLSLKNDNWSVGLSTGNIGVHFEQTIVVSEKEPIILTELVDNYQKL